MGKVVSFRRALDLVPSEGAGNLHPASVGTGTRPPGSEAKFATSFQAEERKFGTVSAVCKRIDLARSARRTGGKQMDHDAYLLVLLADQELSAGRNDEAVALLDAAYDAFDRCAGDQRGITATG
jgi:hypothetical protein